MTVSEITDSLVAGLAGRAVYPKTDDRTIKVAVSHDGGHDFDWYLQACPTIGPSVFY